MAISGSVDYSIDRDSLISHAYKILGALRSGGTATPDEISDATDSLQMMLKAWQSDGLQLWVIKRATLIPELNSQSYSLGPSGDHASLNMFKTEMRVAATAAATTMEVDSTTNMTALDNVGVTTDDGTIHWTTIASITDSDTFELTTGLDSAAAADNHIYFYTTKIDRPHHVLEVYRRRYDDVVDVPLITLSRQEYYTLSDKDSLGTPVNYYYDPQLTNSTFYTWPTADTDFAKNDTFELIIRKPFDDMDASTDDFEFPQEWYEAIVYGLAVRIAPMIGYPTSDRRLLMVEADEIKQTAMDFDVEQTSMFLIP